MVPAMVGVETMNRTRVAILVALVALGIALGSAFVAARVGAPGPSHPEDCTNSIRYKSQRER